MRPTGQNNNCEIIFPNKFTHGNDGKLKEIPFFFSLLLNIPICLISRYTFGKCNLQQNWSSGIHGHWQTTALV